MDKQQNKQFKKVVAWVCIAALVALLAVMPLLAAPQQEQDGPQASILTAEAERRQIETVLLGGGLLASKETVELTIPAQVKLKEYLVGNGDVVCSGDPIAVVDRVSVMTAVAQVQQSMEELSVRIEAARTETVDNNVTAKVAGTVKLVYGQPGDPVSQVMLEHGALAVLSLDDRMAVSFPADAALEPGASVSVTVEGSSAVSGTVVSNLEGTLVVTIPDKGYEIGTVVSVSTEEGEPLGTGELYLYSPWKVYGYSGTITGVSVREGQKVYSGQTLFRLTDTGRAAEYQELINQRREYEQLLTELLRMYDSEVITAPCDGIISGVDVNGAFLMEEPETAGQASAAAQGQLSSSSSGRHSVVRLSAPSDEGGALSIVTASPLPVGTAGQPYSVQLEASEAGGVWTESGLAAAGLTLDGATGLISGTPSAAFSGTVTVWYTLGETPVSKDFSLTIEAQPPQYTGYVGKVTLVNPGLLQVLQGSTAYPITALDQIPPITPNESELTQSMAYQTSASVEQIKVGDIVLLVFDESGALVHPEVLRSSGGETPGQGGTNTPGQGGMPGMGGIHGLGGLAGFAGMAGMGMEQQEEDTLYSLDTLTVATVTSQEQMQVQITVDERDILKLREGQSAILTVDAQGGEQFAARISEIAITGTNDGGRTKFAVTVTVEKHADMYPGMTASVRIGLEEARTVVTIPVAALVEQGTKLLVYTGYDPEEEMLTDPVEVTTGISDGEYVEVMGLAEGAQVCYAYYDTLEQSFTPESGFGFGG